ncbi:hypothetical protein QEG98_03135 [Myxococcus sp. MxC21-1]|uniref:hypothetical protein n=1 Tax=Myxococcus sp. MxC21-1 TaxID=3041439 RepID=UPI002B30892A|nr:hypothetical protein QEG98_03135 [Myxococcus sp. MxC21-1]
MAQAKVADLFASRARNVMMFFTDLLGMPETYNAPGTVDERNWSLRVPQDWAREYRERLKGDAAVNLPAALAMALRAQGLRRARGTSACWKDWTRWPASCGPGDAWALSASRPPRGEWGRAAP